MLVDVELSSWWLILISGEQSRQLLLTDPPKSCAIGDWTVTQALLNSHPGTFEQSPRHFWTDVGFITNQSCQSLEHDWDNYYTIFFYINFYKKMSLKNPKTLKKMLRKSPAEMPELQFLKTLIFPSALSKLKNWVNFSFFCYLKFFSVSIMKEKTFIVSVKPN